MIQKTFGAQYIVLSLFFAVAFVTARAEADVFINVLAVNAKDYPKEKEIRYSLPGELKPEDIVDTNGLTLDYDINQSGYFLKGMVSLGPGETKEFKVQVRDVWEVSDEQVKSIQDKIQKASEELASDIDDNNRRQLKESLNTQLNFILEQQESFSESVERRIDAYRTYVGQIKQIESKSLSLDYWRSDPNEEVDETTIKYVIEVENPTEKIIYQYEEKHYLPKEVKPEHILNYEGYEIRFDESRKQPFLFKENDLEAQKTKKVEISILNVWFIPKKDIDYVTKRANYAYDALKKSKYAKSAEILYNRITEKIQKIEASQAESEDIYAHISTYRLNLERYQDARRALDELEKLLSLFRETLEKSKVKNVLQRVKSLKSFKNVSDAMFDKKPRINTAWKIIIGCTIFVAFITLISFGVGVMRSSKEKELQEIEIEEEENTEEDE